MWLIASFQQARGKTNLGRIFFYCVVPGYTVEHYEGISSIWPSFRQMAPALDV